MQLLETIEIRGGQHGRIELSQGDLTDLSPSERADVLVVSAFPDDYKPTKRSLIGALRRRGLSVKKLARKKDQARTSTPEHAEPRSVTQGAGPSLGCRGRGPGRGR